MEFERVRKRMVDALSSMQKPVHQEPSDMFHKGSEAEQVGPSVIFTPGNPKYHS